MITFTNYYITGILVSFYFIYYYKIKLKRPIVVKDLFLATIGPIVFPLQIIKHLIEDDKNT